jgi:hypothetical protein
MLKLECFEDGSHNFLPWASQEFPTCIRKIVGGKSEETPGDDRSGPPRNVEYSVVRARNFTGLRKTLCITAVSIARSSVLMTRRRLVFTGAIASLNEGCRPHERQGSENG